MFPHVFVAGTFDGLHKGHLALLSRAFAEGERVTMGLTSDLFVRKFKIFDFQFSNNENLKFKIRGFADRKRDLQQWLASQGYSNRSTIVPIDNPYEPAVAVKDVDALVVSSQTRKRGEEINQRRRKNGLSELTLIEVPMERAEDGRPISSTRVRIGEITTQGKLVLPDNLRPELRKPLGRLLKGEEIAFGGKIIITVGDATSETALDLGTIPNLAVIDLHIERKVHDTLASVPEILLYYGMAVASGPGFISEAAQRAIRAWATHCQPTLLIVKGEEDLLTLPAIVEAPLGSFVYYGQPGEGIVEVAVTDEKKRETLVLLAKFT